jgi:hypothetical protein
VTKRNNEDTHSKPLVPHAESRGDHPTIITEAALDYLKLGFKPVLLKPRDKTPLHNNWPQRQLNEADIRNTFVGSHNIGLQCGPASGGLVDVEFDSETMRSLAPQFLPPTRAIFGRRSKPRSHWLYRCPALHDGQHGAAISIKDAGGKEMASLRIGDDGKGTQSMVPPSTHPSGEPVEWDEGAGPEPAEVGAELKRQFSLCGVAALLADHWPREQGSRNAIANAAAGWLARSDVSEEEATKIISAAADYARDEEAKSRRRCVKDTYCKHKKGEQIVGWPTLVQLIDGRAAKQLAKVLAPKSRFPDVTKAGTPRANSPANVATAIELLGIECRHDLFNLRYSTGGHVLDEFVGELSDPALYWLREMIFQRFGLHATIQIVKEAVYTIANHHRFHPVRDHLDGLKWDGVPRIDQWLITYGGAEDTEYTRAALVLIAAARRVREPGCKFDEILVLENPEQGTNKSQALQVLAVKPEWFSDNLPLGVSAKETIEALSGHWILEISELQGMRKSDIDKVKAFASRSVDRARMAYGVTVIRAPRQCIIVGTTNSEKYLRDLTGNRRFWPVRVGRFDLDALQRDRDQLWAEAAAREASGASIRLPEALWPAAATEQAERMIENPFVSVLDHVLQEPREMVNGEWVDGQPMQGKIAVEDVWAILQIRPVQRSQQQYELMGNAMKQLSWERSRLREGGAGKRAYYYVRGPQPYRQIAVTVVDGSVIASYDNDPPVRV